MHEIVMKDQVLFVTPSLEETYCELQQMLSQLEFVVLGQTRVRYVSSYVNVSNESPSSNNYVNLINKLCDSGQTLIEAYSSMRKIVEMTRAYIQVRYIQASIILLSLKSHLNFNLNDWVS
jgi:hypothetical protein